MFAFDQFLADNEDHCRAFRHGRLTQVPSRRVAVVTCMDPRLNPHDFLGLDIGEGHVIRNAGGRITEDVCRSLIVSQRLLGTREIVVVHHTDCELMTVTNTELESRIRLDLGIDVGHRDFLPISDLEESVREDVQTLRESSLVSSGVAIKGAIYDVHTGRLRPVLTKEMPIVPLR